MYYVSLISKTIKVIVKVSYSLQLQIFFQAVAVSVLLYGCTTWTLSKRMEKKLDGLFRVLLKKKILEATPYKTAVVPPIPRTTQKRSNS